MELFRVRELDIAVVNDCENQYPDWAIAVWEWEIMDVARVQWLFNKIEGRISPILRLVQNGETWQWEAGKEIV